MEKYLNDWVHAQLIDFKLTLKLKAVLIVDQSRWYNLTFGFLIEASYAKVGNSSLMDEHLVWDSFDG